MSQPSPGPRSTFLVNIFARLSLLLPDSGRMFRRAIFSDLSQESTPNGVQSFLLLTHGERRKVIIGQLVVWAAPAPVRPFYVYPNEHLNHTSPLAKEVVQYLNKISWLQHHGLFEALHTSCTSEYLVSITSLQASRRHFETMFLLSQVILIREVFETALLCSKSQPPPHVARPPPARKRTE